MTKISPSILAADPMRLGDEARAAVEAGVDELHFDVMDGHFVPNITFGPHILKGMKGLVPNTTYDVHLMLDQPMVMIDSYAKAGADIITIHAEIEKFDEALDMIRSYGNIQVGAALRPKTSVEVLRPYVGQLDRILLMTVEPGFGGQKLMPDTLVKARELRALGFQGEIEADGGITMDNSHLLSEAGFDVLVMGTGFFKAPVPADVAARVHAL